MILDPKRHGRALLVAAAAALLAACGGGSGSASSAPAGATSDAVPAAASRSVADLISWASTLPQSDNSAPLSTDQASLPVDDTAQATPI